MELGGPCFFVSLPFQKVIDFKQHSHATPPPPQQQQQQEQFSKAKQKMLTPQPPQQTRREQLLLAHYAKCAAQPRRQQNHNSASLSKRKTELIGHDDMDPDEIIRALIAAVPEPEQKTISVSSSTRSSSATGSGSDDDDYECEGSHHHDHHHRQAPSANNSNSNSRRPQHRNPSPLRGFMRSSAEVYSARAVPKSFLTMSLPTFNQALNTTISYSSARTLHSQKKSTTNTRAFDERGHKLPEVRVITSQSSARVVSQQSIRGSFPVPPAERTEFSPPPHSRKHFWPKLPPPDPVFTKIVQPRKIIASEKRDRDELMKKKNASRMLLPKTIEDAARRAVWLGKKAIREEMQEKLAEEDRLQRIADAKRRKVERKKRELRMRAALGHLI